MSPSERPRLVVVSRAAPSAAVVATAAGFSSQGYEVVVVHPGPRWAELLLPDTGAPVSVLQVPSTPPEDPYRDPYQRADIARGALLRAGPSLRARTEALARVLAAARPGAQQQTAAARWSLTEAVRALQPDALHGVDDATRSVVSDVADLMALAGAVPVLVTGATAPVPGTLTTRIPTGAGRQAPVPGFRLPAQVPGTAPHVVLVRPVDLGIDTRAKRIALSLTRAGYRVTVLVSSSAPPAGPVRLGAADVRNVALVWPHRDAARVEMARLAEKATRATAPASPRARARRWGRDSISRALDAGATRLAPEWRLALPQPLDLTTAFLPAVLELDPDVLHVHDPWALAMGWEARAIAHARGRELHLVYDARENWAGMPLEEQGSPERHAAEQALEREFACRYDAVTTVSEPIAEVMVARLGLRARPTVVANMPPYRSSPRRSAPDLRERAGLAPGLPLLVYSGAMSRARGVETLVRALGELPGVHLALMTVPFPHPLLPELLEAADEVGARERVHPLAPVDAEDLLHVLSGADVGVHPMVGGAPNHEAAMPNKLFEYLHAGLPLVVSDVREMARFVRENGIGEVFRSGDVSDLARAVRAVLAEPQRYAEPSRRAVVSAMMSWQHQEQILLGVYAALVPAPEPGPWPEEFPPMDVVPA